MRAEKEYDPYRYWYELLSKDFSLSGVGFLGLGKAYNKWLYRARQRAFDRVVKKLPMYLGAKGVLDIGCGTGFYVNLWAERGVERLVGLDITEISVEKLSQEYPRYEFYVSDISEKEQPYKGDSFDVVTAFDVLFHIVDDEKFERSIQNISKFTKTGGYILISDNFPKVYQEAVYCQKNRTLEYYRQVFMKHGIDILHIKPIFFIMNAPVDLQGKRRIYKFIFKMTWRIIRRAVRSNESFGNLVGMFTYYLDYFIILFCKNSPTTKLLIAKKRSV